MRMSEDRALRERLIAHLERSGVLASPGVARALLAVPRHHFLPGIPIEHAYDDRALVIKEQAGQVLSSISQPSMIVQMLQLLDVRPEDRVLEIGTGSGYNAALLATLAGYHGHVASAEIEPDLLETARERLDALGLRNVRVLHAADVASLEGPFSRIIVTARADDIEPDWWRLLADGGRIVVPLALGIGGERAFGFVRDGDVLRTIASHPCAFIGLRGDGDDRSGDTFFLNREARYAVNSSAPRPVELVAMPKASARVELLERADAVVARRTTIFAVNIEAGQHTP
jgi:protein-L-isoaspartate(D-aspartate) O-methyltransferase